MTEFLPNIDTIAAIAILIVGFGFHFCGQLISVLNWKAAQRLGLQEPDLPPGYYPYEHGTAVADVLIAWVYGMAALGLFMGTHWGYQLAAIPGAILLYHGIGAWFCEADRRRQGTGLFSDRLRLLWCGANIATGALALTVAATGTSAP